MNSNLHGTVGTEIEGLAQLCCANTKIPPELYTEYNVKKGLRDKSGAGVLAGLTNISTVIGFQVEDGKTVPCEGKLLYRGIDVKNIVRSAAAEKRTAFEEAAYLLLFGSLPDAVQLRSFTDILAGARILPTNFVRDVIMKAPTEDIMNSLSRSVLTLAAYDKKADDTSLPNVLRQCISLIGLFPMLSVYSYHAYNHYIGKDSMYIHYPDKSHSAAGTLLHLLRPNNHFTPLDEMVLDMCLVLHMEHGGGNNSTFTTHVVTSSGSDTYSTIAAALGSLKGPKHGGANIKVVQMIDDLRKNVKDSKDEDQIRAYLLKLLHGQAFDRKGLIYGMGHAVYSLSDPRAQVFKEYVEALAVEKGREDDFALYSAIERLAPQVIASERNIYKGVSANVDFYSGFVYSMLDIPRQLFTPIFATARIVGWSAHRMEELINVDKIIRPAYKSLSVPTDYLPLAERATAKE